MQLTLIECLLRRGSSSDPDYLYTQVLHGEVEKMDMNTMQTITYGYLDYNCDKCMTEKFRVLKKVHT